MNLKTLLQIIYFFLTFSIIQSCNLFSKKDETLIIPLRTEFTTVDPHLAYDYVSNFVTYQIYETLYAYSYLKRPYSVEPLIAEDMPEIFQGGKILRVKIKKNILYQPNPFIPKNRTVKAQDFVNSFKRYAYKHTGSRAWWLAKGIFQGLDDINKKIENLESLQKANIEGIKAIDDYTLEFHLQNPLPPHQVLNLLCMSFTTPIPEEVFTKMNNDLTKYQVGTGAYILQKFEAKIGAELSYFKDYKTVKYPNSGDRVAHELNYFTDANKDIPFIKNVSFKIITDEVERWKFYQENELAILELPRTFLPEVFDVNGSIKTEVTNKGMQLEQTSSLTFWFLEMNMKDKIVGKNKLLRQAIAHAINIETYLHDYNNNADQKANSLYPPGVFGYAASKDLPYKYDLEKAKKLLEKAGYPGGKNLPVLKLDTRRDKGMNITQAEFVKSQLAEIGIKIEIVVNTFNQFIEKSKKKEMQIWQGGWLMDFPDAENILQLFYSANSPDGGPNKSQYSNVLFDETYLKIVKMTNSPEKFIELEKAEKIINEDLPVIMFYYAKNYYLYRNKIKNFRLNELSMGFIKYLKID